MRARLDTCQNFLSGSNAKGELIMSTSRLNALLCIPLLALLGACGSREQTGDASAPAQPEAARSSATASHRVFVTNEMSGDMTVIDGDTLQVVATIPLGKRPRGIQVSPDGKQLFVALSGSPIAPPGVDEDDLPPADKGADGIGIVDIESLQLLRILRGVSDPEQLSLSKDGKRIYVASEDTGTAVIFDVDSGEVVATLPVGGEPEGVTTSPDGKFVYMTSEEDHQVAVIDTEQNKVVATIEVGERPRAIAFSPDSSRAYVTGEFDGTVSVIDAREHKVLETIKLEGEMVRPMEVDTSPDGSKLYVTTGRGRTLVVIDAATSKPEAAITVGERPWGLAVSPDGKRLYTANGPSNDVSVVDAETLQVIATVPAGNRPWGVVAR
jgi:YVTN family beta-propeller protein